MGAVHLPVNSDAPVPELHTPRLLLRGWRESDRAPFASLNADDQVMEYFRSTLSPSESNAAIERHQAHFEREGFGKWAVELNDSQEFVGTVGIERATFAAPFTPAVEIGWRLARKHWGHGYATEAASRVLDLAFSDLNLDEVVAFTPESNVRSQQVMRRIGMVRDRTADFQDSRLQPEHPLARNVTYRIHSRE
jgi:RimJ/RimL family protein N-acetyltransferase